MLGILAIDFPEFLTELVWLEIKGKLMFTLKNVRALFELLTYNSLGRALSLYYKFSINI